MSTIVDDIMEFLPEEPPAPLTAAERTRQWRARLKAEGRPETKTVDAAISEAVNYLMSIATSAPVLVNAADIVRMSTIILKRDGYNRQSAKEEVIERLRPRDRHHGFESMPSRNPHENLMLVRAPAGGGGWSESDLEYMKRIAGRTFSRD